MRAALAVLALLVFSGCGAAPAPHGTRSPRRSTDSELIGCYRVAMFVDRDRHVPANPLQADLAPFEQSTLYCLEADRYHFKPAGSNWNSVLTHWSVQPTGSERGVERVAVAWTSDAQPRVRFSMGCDERGPLLPMCCVDPEACRPEHAYATPCSLTFARAGDRFRLEGAASVALVPLDTAASAQARAEIARLEPVDRVCAAAVSALRKIRSGRREIVADESNADCHGECASAVDWRHARLADVDESALRDLGSCKAMLQATSTFDRTGAGASALPRACEELGSSAEPKRRSERTRSEAEPRARTPSAPKPTARPPNSESFGEERGLITRRVRLVRGGHEWVTAKFDR